MNHPILYVPAVNCSVSSLNVRKSSDPDADAQFATHLGETSIVIQNLVGVPEKRKKGRYSIFAGGRRLRGVLDQIEKGKLPRDFQVPVMVMPNAKDAIEMSLAENYYKLAMNPADACTAFRDLIDREGKTVEQIAKRYGLSVRFVEGRLRLANLAEPIFTALRDETITLEVAQAYASTSDTGRQAAVFAEIEDSYYANNVNEIRRRLAIGAYRGADPKALFVGRDDYVAAGGRVDGDLFSDTESETWIDGDIVDRLAEEKLQASAAALREREGYGEVRPMPTLHVPYSETCQLRRIDGEPVPLSAAAQARRAEIETELSAIEEAAQEAEDYTEEQSDRIEVLEEELEALMDTGVLISDEQRAAAIAYVVLGSDGQPRVHEQLYALPATKDVQDVQADDGDGDNAESSQPEAQPGEARYSVRLVDELATMKTELLAVHVANDPHFALDLGIFIMVDNATRTEFYHSMPSELRANAPAPRVGGFESGTPASEAWAKLEEELNRCWTGHKEIEQRYDAFCALDQTERAAWLGWAVARTLHAVPDGAAGSSFLDHLGRKLGIDVAAWWRPTARNFFDRITKPAILALFELVGGAELKSRYAASRKFDLAVSAEKLFAGQVIVEADVKERALAWLPNAMRFQDPDPVEPAVDGARSCNQLEAGQVVMPEADGASDGLPEAA